MSGISMASQRPPSITRNFSTRQITPVRKGQPSPEAFLGLGAQNWLKANGRGRE
jgi:hypothetical protein